MQPILTFITDCQDDNARARTENRIKALFKGANPTFIGSEHPIQASGNLVDAIDATRLSTNKMQNIFIVNVAPRALSYGMHPNGIPFCFSKTRNGIIIGTPNCFSLPYKLGLLSDVFETDVFEVCSKFLSSRESNRIARSQFRSFEYLPLLAKWLYEGNVIPGKKFQVQVTKENVVWNIDNFGNCKTTILNTERKNYSNEYKFIKRLAEVPKDSQEYLIEGSSGYCQKRFLEIIIQGNNAAKVSNISIGDKV